MEFDDFAVDDRAALAFFRTALEETSAVQSRPGQPPELPYCASILAHFSSTSTESTGGIPAPRHLIDVFDQYVLSTLAQGDADLMEDAGAKTLLLLGFFHRGMAASRHNVDWYRRLGRSFFHEAATLTDDQKRKYILMLVSRRFELWQLAFCELEATLRHRRYLLHLDGEQGDSRF
jgi:hypothetical protein